MVKEKYWLMESIVFSAVKNEELTPVIVVPIISTPTSHAVLFSETVSMIVP